MSRILSLCLLIVTACGQLEVASDPAAPSASPTSSGRAAPATALTRIDDPSQVCMVRNQFLGQPQIPVPVGEKTYFGCCAGCKKRLEDDARARFAVDPVSGHAVDKALAVMARDTEGRVLYFESDRTLQRYGR
jgi:YHS domain-containing protein